VSAAVRRFGRWTVERLRGRVATVRCECGTARDIRIDQLESGHSRSCGCAVRTLRGMGGSTEYRIWANMRDRCMRKKCPAYRYYGGRGIRICRRWDSFAAFYEDMGPRPAGKSLDRIDNDGDYKPGNCRWATVEEQANNKRQNVKLTHRGVTRTLAEWDRHLGLVVGAMHYRVTVAGWSTAKACSTRSLAQHPDKAHRREVALDVSRGEAGGTARELAARLSVSPEVAKLALDEMVRMGLLLRRVPRGMPIAKRGHIYTHTEKGKAAWLASLR
jgi:hypothetical protein